MRACQGNQQSPIALSELCDMRYCWHRVAQSSQLAGDSQTDRPIRRVQQAAQRLVLPGEDAVEILLRCIGVCTCGQGSDCSSRVICFSSEGIQCQPDRIITTPAVGYGVQIGKCAA